MKVILVFVICIFAIYLFLENKNENIVILEANTIDESTSTKSFDSPPKSEDLRSENDYFENNTKVKEAGEQQVSEANESWLPAPIDIPDNLQDLNTDEKLELFRECKNIPRSQEDLKEFISLSEKASMNLAENSGEIQSSNDLIYLNFKSCKRLRDTFSKISYRDLLEISATEGNTESMVRLAIDTPPSNFNSWPDERKDKYKKKMSAHMNTAFESCDLSALKAIKHHTIFGEGTYWELEKINRNAKNIAEKVLEITNFREKFSSDNSQSAIEMDESVKEYLVTNCKKEL